MSEFDDNDDDTLCLDLSLKLYSHLFPDTSVHLYRLFLSPALAKRTHATIIYVLRWKDSTFSTLTICIK